MDPDADLAAQLRELRRRARLTIEELAERSGVSARAIGDIERGARSPRTSTMRALVGGLGLSEDQADAFYDAARSTGPGRIPDLQSSVSPLRLGDFTGREDELAEMIESLAEPSAVMVVTGSAGFGKTTLAVEAASRFDEKPFVFVDLGGLGRPTLSALQVLQDLLRQADPHAEPSPTLNAAAVRWAAVAAASRPVVILDNVVDEDQVRPVVGTTERGPVILTSRRTVAGITATARVRLESLDDGSSVRLLEHVIPESQRADADLAELAELCQGVPLALRIAANRVASRPATSVGDYVERLKIEERRLSLLVAGDMSVEAALNTSYEELDPEAAELFRSLSLIEGTTFTSDVAAIAAGTEAWRAEELVEGLVDVGLVEARGHNRFRLHDLIRVFAGSRLRVESDPEQIGTARDRLSYSFVRTLLTLGRPPKVEAPDSWPGYSFTYPGFGTDVGARAWGPLEQECWWAAIRWVAERGDHEAVLLAARALESRIAAWPELPQLLELQHLALRSARALGDRRAESLRLSALTWGAIIVLGDPPAALEYAQQAVEASTASGDLYAIAKARFMTGTCSIVFMQDLAAAEGHLLAAVDGFMAAGSEADATEVRAFLGAFYRRSGRVEESIRELEIALDVVGRQFEDDEPTTYSNARGTALAELTAAYISTGQPQKALPYAENLVEGWSPESDFYEGRARAIRATALAAVGRVDDARRELVEVAALLAPYEDSGQAQIAQEHIAQANALIEAADA
jgi:transcriptional regulator with XRE-family HTH domain/tetratricopeptide (TPR) repeat protein